MNEMCRDNRFEIIEKAKKHLLEATNIKTSEDEMKVLDNFLFRCWQMGWLDKYDNHFKSGVVWTEEAIKNKNILTSYTTAACTKGKWANGAAKTCQFCMYYFEGRGCQNQEMYRTDCSWL